MPRKRRSFSARLIPELARALGFSVPHDPAGALDVAWPVLARAFEAAFGFPLTVSDRLAFERMLRDLDAVVAGLDDHGIRDLYRTSAILRGLAPWLGVRFGAAAAWVDAGLAPAALSAVPGLADRLCDPFADDVFSWALDATLQALRPEWRDREAQIRGLAREGVATRRTIRTWFEPDDPPSLKAFQRLLARLAPVDHPALVPLRLARACSLWRPFFHRNLLAFGAVGDEAVAAWARTTRESIAKHRGVDTVLVSLAYDFETRPHRLPLFLSRKAGRFGKLLAGVPGSRIPDLFRRVLDRGEDDPTLARWRAAVIAETVLDPPIDFVRLTVLVADAWPPDSLSPPDLARRVGWEWNATARVAAIARGGPVEVAVPGEAAARAHDPSPDLRHLAEECLAGFDPAIEKFDRLRIADIFWAIEVLLLHEAAGPSAVEAMLADKRSASLPDKLEKHVLNAHETGLVGDAPVAAVPRLSLYRSHSWVARHDLAEVWPWFERWANASTARDPDALRTAAFTIRHAVDRIVKRLREKAGDLSRRDRAALLAEADRWRDAGRKAMAGRVLDEAIAMDLVVAIRLDAAEARLEGLPTPAYRRAAEAARAVDERLAAEPDQPDLVAARVLWRWVRHGPDPRDLRRILAVDAAFPYRCHRDRLRADGLLPS